MNLGAHMSISGGVHMALRRARSIGCNAVQLFVKSSNQWRAKPLSEEEISLFREESALFQPGFVIAHSSYLLNIASPDPGLRGKSEQALRTEMERCAVLGIPSLVLHPGSHRGEGLDGGIARIAASLDRLFAATQGGVSILLETTAGTGNIIGASFEELASIIGLVSDRTRVGVCFDTCHAFAAGYDIRARRAYEATMRRFDGAIGLGLLRAFHLNDSRTALGSRRDRHAQIGDGRIGERGFANLLRDRRFDDRPMILETPKGPDLAEDVENLARLRRLRG
ncbi:MAG: deoxyribonuclease IV [Candidatus Krumholzibacteria bacterium]|nr:deoxyribonuclease IV [Candidatus Krumholzibacteria bacterium]